MCCGQNVCLIFVCICSGQHAGFTKGFTLAGMCIEQNFGFSSVCICSGENMECTFAGFWIMVKMLALHLQACVVV
jgi:hypothetical protein